MSGFLLYLLLVLVLAGGLLRLRQRRRWRARTPEVDDEALHRILTEGRLEVEEDEPLDPDLIEEEERRFWEEERWDGAEEF